MEVDIIGGFPLVDPNCQGCGKPLLQENAWMSDGCPCNNQLGCNNQNETRWRLLMQLQQAQSLKLQEPQWITDPDTVVDAANYVVFALGQRPNKSTYVYKPEVRSGWQFKRLTPGCYVAIPLPAWAGGPEGEKLPYGGGPPCNPPKNDHTRNMFA